MTRFFQLSFVATVCLVASTMAIASRYGDDLSRQTNPPYTTQVTNALKTLGSYYAYDTGTGKWLAVGSSVLIHPQWIIGAPHGIAYDPAKASGFDLSSGLVTTPKYKVVYCYNFQVGSTLRGADDIGLCRLEQPVPASEAVPVPLVEAPEELQPDNANESLLATDRQSLRGKLTKWGKVLHLGHSNSKKPGDAWLPAIVDFGGLPYDFEAARGLTKLPTINSSGDSGSGLFWISPTSGDVALMAVMSYEQHAPIGAAFLRKVTLDWIEDTLWAISGHTITRLAAEQHATYPTGDVVAELTSKPVIKSVNNSRSTFDVSWPVAAAGTPSVGRYEVSWYRQGQVCDAQTSAESCVPKDFVNAGMGNSYRLPGLVAGQYTACVRPVGANGYAALPAFLFVSSPGALDPIWTLETPNCQFFDTTLPLAAMSAVTSTLTKLSSVGIVKFSWSAGSPAPVRYEVTRTISFPSGPSRVSTTETTAATYSASSTVGSTVCLSVKALNALGMVAAPQSKCVTIN